jgi:hypothetical protein
MQSHRSRRLNTCHRPRVPPPDLFCGGVGSCKGDLATGEAQHAFSCGYVWLEFDAKPVSVVLRKAVVAVASKAERDRLHLARHTFVVKRPKITSRMARCQLRSDSGHAATVAAGCCNVFSQTGFAKARPVSTGYVRELPVRW